MSQNDVAASAKTEEDDVSDDPSVHDPQCHYFQYAQVHCKGLRSKEQIKQRLLEDMGRRRGRTGSVAEINNQLTKAMSPTGIISQYLKSKSEMYASYKPLLKSFCQCESAKIGNIKQEMKEGQDRNERFDERAAQGQLAEELGHQETLPIIGEGVEPKVEPASLGTIEQSGVQTLTENQLRSLKDVGLDLSEDDEDDEDEEKILSGSGEERDNIDYLTPHDDLDYN